MHKNKPPPSPEFRPCIFRPRGAAVVLAVLSILLAEHSNTVMTAAPHSALVSEGWPTHSACHLSWWAAWRCFATASLSLESLYRLSTRAARRPRCRRRPAYKCSGTRRFGATSACPFRYAALFSCPHNCVKQL